MTQPLETVAIIPLMLANLCPQCDAIVNQTRCPICNSQTIVLARILSERKTS